MATLLWAAGPVAAEDCPRGALDARYCDADGDMVADPPALEDQIDPSTLIFAYTPVEDPAVYAPAWQGFIAHLERITGKKVRLFQVQSNSAQLEALRSGRLHIAGVNTGSVPIAVNCAGYVPFSMMAGPSGPYAYEMEILVPVNSQIQTPTDLKGHTIAFTSPTSNSGFKAPAFMLESEFGLKAGIDYESVFSGKHDSSILGVANADYEAAAIANSVLGRMIERGAVDPSKFRSIYKSPSFPTTGYGYAYNLKPELAEKIRAAFLSYDIGQDEKMAPEFPGQDRFITMTYKAEWDIVRRIDAGTGVKYDCK
ncbi:MAG: phosphate/phosphite/phosphonate ABC transporter substrate-binding protein [Rhodobacteraceae bacterium]|nr:phosphate/phosphite/phosphonate ABC transporter substrate-binding protein [Paracoccaceae bacterium]